VTIYIVISLLFSRADPPLRTTVSVARKVNFSVEKEDILRGAGRDLVGLSGRRLLASVLISETDQRKGF